MYGWSASILACQSAVILREKAFHSFVSRRNRKDFSRRSEEMSRAPVLMLITLPVIFENARTGDFFLFRNDDRRE
jgi:hypothetical protein